MISLDRTVAKLNKLLAPVERIPKRPTVPWLRKQLKRLDKGKLYGGGHGVDEHAFCALEFVNTVQDGVKVRVFEEGWGGRRLSGNLSDEPDHMPDLRDLNDSDFWKNDKDRTDHLLPLMAALWNYKKWTSKQRARFKRQAVLAAGYELTEDAGRANLLKTVATALKVARACRGKW